MKKLWSIVAIVSLCCFAAYAQQQGKGWKVEPSGSLLHIDSGFEFPAKAGDLVRIRYYGKGENPADKDAAAVVYDVPGKSFKSLCHWCRMRRMQLIFWRP